MKNIIKLSTSIRQTIKLIKNLKICINGQKIEAKEENYTIIDTKTIILFFQIFYIFIQIFIFLAVLGNKL